MRLVTGAVLLGQVLSAGPARHQAESVPAIVSAGWLARHLHDAGIVVVQHGGSDQYERGHIPGSVLLPAEGLENREMMAQGGSMDMSTLPTPEGLRRGLQALGVSDSSRVIVVFTAKELPQTTRAILWMRYAGLTQVSLLDGGLEAWRGGGFPMIADPSSVAAGHFSVALDSTLIVDYRYVQEHRRDPHVRLIDARAPVYYDGPQERGSMIMPAGHIPEAKNVPYSSLFDEHLHFRSRPEIEALFRAAGVLPGDTVIAYCHVGIQATVVMLAARLAGHPARMYAGSFHDWSSRNLPTEGGRK